MHPPREIALAQAISWIVALAGSAAAFSCAFVLLLADREVHATAFGLGGVALLAWAAIDLTDRRHDPR